MNAITSRFTSRKITNNSRGKTTSPQTIHAWITNHIKNKKKTAFDDAMKKVHFRMLLRLKFLFKCKRSHKYLKKKPLFTGKEETHSLITQRRSRGVQRDRARTHTRKQRERYTMRRSTRAHRSSSGKEEGKEKRNLESPFPIRKRSDDTSEFEDDFVEKKTTTKKTKRKTPTMSRLT